MRKILELVGIRRPSRTANHGAAATPYAGGEKPYDVFISSIQTPELTPYREAAYRTLEKMPGVRPWTFERAPASSENVTTGYLRRAADADAIVLLLGESTSTPVLEEIAEALGDGPRLWVFLLPGTMDESSKRLISLVQPVARYHSAASPAQLEAELNRTFWDEAVRSLRGEASPTRRATVESLKRASLARCQDGWRALGVSQEQARELADDLRVGAPDPSWYPTTDHPVRLILGDLGAGKSLVAERMLQDALDRAGRVEDTRVPVYVRATEVGASLEQAVLTLAETIGNPRVLGAFIVVDGLDEISLSRAEGIQREARVLGVAWPNTHLVLTSRPLPGESSLRDAIPMPPLSQDEALALASRFAGQELGVAVWHYWPEAVREASQRPLFAILLGLHAAATTKDTPQSQGDLIDSLVNRALRGRETPDDAQEALEELATRITDGELGVSAADLRAARTLRPLIKTGIVVERSGRYRFPLPILAQWFAAHALISGRRTVSELISAGKLDAWYYPLAVSVSIAGEAMVDGLLGELSRKDPAFAAQVLEEGVPQLLERVLPPPAMEAGRRVREAAQAWAEGIGKLARKIAPVGPNDLLLPLGVRTRETDLRTAWYVGADDLDPVVMLPTNVHPLVHTPDWMRGQMGPTGRASGWPWRWSFEEFRLALSESIKRREFPISNTTVVNERYFGEACAVLGRGPAYLAPLDLATVSLRVDQVLMANPGTDPVRYIGPAGGAAEVRTLKQYIDQLRASGITSWTLERPLPDLQPSAGPLISSGYSLGQLISLVEAVFRKAIPAYVDLVETWFLPFSMRLQHYQLLPARIEGHVKLRPPGFPGGPIIDVMIEPLPYGRQPEVSFEPGIRTTVRDLHERTEQVAVLCQELRPRAAEWLWPVAYSSVMGEFFMSDAVTHVVYHWLKQDLSRVEWLRHAL